MALRKYGSGRWKLGVGWVRKHGAESLKDKTKPIDKTKPRGLRTKHCIQNRVAEPYSSGRDPNPPREMIAGGMCLH